MESKFLKRICSLAIVVFMVLSMVPTNVFAASTTEDTTPSALNLDEDGNGCPHCEGEVTWVDFDAATHVVRFSLR